VEIVAYLLLRTELNVEYDVLDRIKSLGDCIDDARVTYGQYDIVVRLKCPDMRSLDKVITAIRGIKGVAETMTLISS